MSIEVWKDSRVVFDGRVVRLRVGEVTLDDGSTAEREVVEHPGGVCVVPWTGTHVVLIRQFRIAVGDYVIEAPAGKIEPGDDPETRGRTEVEEEVGYRAGVMETLGQVWATVGFCSERIHLYLARDLEFVGQQLEQDERIEVQHWTLDEVRRGLSDHSLDDAKTVVALHRLLQKLAPTL